MLSLYVTFYSMVEKEFLMPKERGRSLCQDNSQQQQTHTSLSSSLSSLNGIVRCSSSPDFGFHCLDSLTASSKFISSISLLISSRLFEFRLALMLISKRAKEQSTGTVFHSCNTGIPFSLYLSLCYSCLCVRDFE